MYLSIHKKLSWKALLLIVKLAFFPLHNRHSETVKEIFAVVIIFSLAPNTESTLIPCYKQTCLSLLFLQEDFNQLTITANLIEGESNSSKQLIWVPSVICSIKCSYK